jgi:uncharacterized protein YidB (DUF937 family)
MGLLDQVLAQAGQGGNNPLMSALEALLVNSPGGQAAQPSPGGAPDGGLVGGIGGLLQKLQDAGHGETANSWVGPGPNKPIQPGHLGAALGPNTVSAAAQHSGLDEQQLLTQLAQNLPQIIDKLTASGTIPSLQQLAAAFSQAQK